MLPKHQYMKTCTRHWGLIYGIIESRAYLLYIYERFFFVIYGGCMLMLPCLHIMIFGMPKLKKTHAKVIFDFTHKPLKHIIIHTSTIHS